jgi:hypothetical protein
MPGAGVAAIGVAGPVEAWRALGFAIDDDARCRVGATLLCLGRRGKGLTGWALRDAAESASGPLDGIATERVEWQPAAGAQHPNGALSVDHVVVLTPDVPRTFAALSAEGMTLRRERDAGTPERPLRQGFFRHSECIVEVVGPRDAEADAGPARLWGLTLVVADLDATAALLGDALGEVSDAVQPGRRIATVRREAGLGVPLALMSGA